jgi:hypothetical protein
MPIIRDDEKEKHLIANFVFKNLDEVNSNSEDDEDFHPFPVQEMQLPQKKRLCSLNQIILKVCNPKYNHKILLLKII